MDIYYIQKELIKLLQIVQLYMLINAFIDNAKIIKYGYQMDAIKKIYVMVKQNIESKMIIPQEFVFMIKIKKENMN